MKKTLYLCGAGNPEGVRLALRINEATPRWERIILLDDDPAKHGDVILDIPIAGAFDLLAQADPNTDEVQNLVAKDTSIRRKARQKIAQYGLRFVPLIHPEIDTVGVTYDDDLLVFQQAILGTNSTIAGGTVVLMGALVGHGATVGPHCILAPRSVLNARVELGEGVYVGSNATVIPDIKVGANATLGVGSVIIGDVAAGATVFGIPARVVMKTGKQRAATPRGFKRPTPLGPIHNKAPGTLTEQVSRIWQRLLKVPQVHPEDNFFDLGGNSLLAFQLLDDIQRATGKALTLPDILTHPTAASLAAYLKDQNPDKQEANPTASCPAVEHMVMVLRETGIRTGDTVFVHSDLVAFGNLFFHDPTESLARIVRAFEEAVGEDGTIIMPTFTYSPPKPFDVDKTASAAGALSEFFRKQPGVVRTDHPTHSIAVWGRGQARYTTPGTSTFDADSVFGRLLEDDARIVFWGAPLQVSTFNHFIEQRVGVPYRCNIPLKSTIIKNGNTYTKEVQYYARKESLPTGTQRLDFAADYRRFNEHLWASAAISTASLGAGRVMVMEAQTLFREGVRVLQKDPYFFISPSVVKIQQAVL